MAEFPTPPPITFSIHPLGGNGSDDEGDGDDDPLRRQQQEHWGSDEGTSPTGSSPSSSGDGDDDDDSTSISSNASEHDLEVEIMPQHLGFVDWQGIPWPQGSDERARYQGSRLDSYSSLVSNQLLQRQEGPQSGYPPSIDARILISSRITYPMTTTTPMFNFHYTNRMETNTIHHFQLRHLLWTPSLRTVFYPLLNRVRCWNPVTNDSHICLNLAQLGFAYSRCSTVCAMSPTQPATEGATASSDVLLMAAGFVGELVIAKYLPNKESQLVYTGTIGNRDIINHLCASSKSLSISGNDAVLRDLDLEIMKSVHVYQFDWPVNVTTAFLITNSTIDFLLYASTLCSRVASLAQPQPQARPR